LWRTDLVLGRAHNNIGYEYWVYKGRYNAALKELQRAIKFFRASDVREELANTADNMGRIHALLGHRIQSETQIEDGAEIREKLNLPYRQALSQISAATVHLNFHRPDLALPMAEQALTTIRTTGVLRGLGLARITIGRACRMLSEGWRRPGVTLEVAKTYSQRAEVELLDALAIFTDRVVEPIRLIETYNELGCTFRARYEIFNNDPLSSNLVEPTFSQAQINLNRAIRLARQEGDLIAVSDSCQDIAALYFQAGIWPEVEKWLQEAEKFIPAEYKIVIRKGIDALPEEEQVNEYYRLMGGIELLRGSLAISRSGAKPADESVIQAALHYLLSSVYFTKFSRDTYEMELSYRQMYNHLKKSRSELVNRILHEEIRQWVDEYKLEEQPLAGFYRDVFGLFEEK
jgi:tetratricopeptide (TPR) repeat protein